MYAGTEGSATETRAGAFTRARSLAEGNTGDARAVGEGVSELRINYGPGYRIYFTRRGRRLVILPAGGDKDSQSRDIETAAKIGARDAEGLDMIKLLPWDPAEDLETEEDMKEYLEAALELDDDPWIVALVLWDISRAKGVEEIAISAGLDRTSVHKSEKRGDVLNFRAVMDTARALGLRLYAGAASCGESDFSPNSNGGATKTRRPPPSPNGKSAQDMVSRLNAALDGCDAWGAARALRDIAEANGMERVVPDALASETPDFAAFMDTARALGLRIHAAVVDRTRDDDSSGRRGAGDGEIIVTERAR